MASTLGEVFVTVGTTKFDLLISTVLKLDILDVLKSKGYKKIKMQIGNSTMPECNTIENGIEIEYYHFKDSIVEDMRVADLIISHAGAGSCLEALEAKKPLVVVINEDLMGNHQTELAKQLYDDGHLYYTTCKDLCQVLKEMDLTKLKPFEDGNIQAVIEFLDERFGFVV